MYELVHATWPECGSDSIDNSYTSVYVADELCFPLASVCALLEQDDLRLLQAKKELIRELITVNPLGGT